MTRNRVAARKGLDDTALAAMAGKPLDQLDEAEAVALTGRVVRHKVDA